MDYLPALLEWAAQNNLSFWHYEGRLMSGVGSLCWYADDAIDGIEKAIDGLEAEHHMG